MTVQDKGKLVAVGTPIELRQKGKDCRDEVSGWYIRGGWDHTVTSNCVGKE